MINDPFISSDTRDIKIVEQLDVNPIIPHNGFLAHTIQILPHAKLIVMQQMVKRPVFAFIDSQNLNLGVLSLGWKLDFTRFRILLKDLYKVQKAYLFIGHIPGNEGLYTKLQEAGFILIFKPTLSHKVNGKLITKGNVDAELVLHTMIQLKNFSKAIIISGDGGFYCLVDHLNKLKKLEKIIVPNSTYSSLLRKFAPLIVSINSFKKKIQLNSKRRTFARDKTFR